MADSCPARPWSSSRPATVIAGPWSSTCLTCISPTTRASASCGSSRRRVPASSALGHTSRCSSRTGPARSEAHGDQTRSGCWSCLKSKGGNQSMRSNAKAWHQAFWIAGTAALLLAAGLAYAQQPGSGQRAPGAAAVTESPAQARAILMRMADFLGGAQRFSVNVRGGYDAVQQSGQKIEFSEMRTLTLSRPDRLRMEGRRSDGVKTITVFTGKEVVLIDETSNVYATTPQPGGLDATIAYFVRDLGMRLPLAALLLSQLPAELNDRVRSIDYVERTSIHGAPAHHQIGRAHVVDFQVWVADGD